MNTVEERIKKLSDAYKGHGDGEVSIIYELPHKDDPNVFLLIGNKHGMVRMGETWQLEFKGHSIEDVLNKAEKHFEHEGLKCDAKVLEELLEQKRSEIKSLEGKL